MKKLRFGNFSPIQKYFHRKKNCFHIHGEGSGMPEGRGDTSTRTIASLTLHLILAQNLMNNRKTFSGNSQVYFHSNNG